MRKITPQLICVLILAVFLVCPVLWAQQISGNVSDIAREYRRQGAEMQKNGDLEKAYQFYQKAIELDPAYGEAYNDLGIVYEAYGHYDQAKQSYEKAIELDPTIASAYYNLGVLYEKEGNFDKAISYFKERVAVGDYNDEWTQRATEELRSLGVTEPIVNPALIDEHLVDFNSDEIRNARPKGNDLDPKRRMRQAQMHLLKSKQALYAGRYEEAWREVGMAEAYDSRNKDVQRAVEEIQRKVLMSTN